MSWRIGNWRMVCAFLLVVSIFSSGSVEAQGSSAPELIPNTTLRVSLPPGWQVDRTARVGSPQLKHVGESPYLITVSISSAASQGRSCMDLIGFLLVVSPKDEAVPRPAFIPDVYMGSTIRIPKMDITCLSSGTGILVVTLLLPSGTPNPDIARPMLAAIAEAALRQSAAVAAPGRLELPLLGIEIPIRSGVWGVQQISDTWGTNNIVSRRAQSGSNEIHITPFVFKLPGRCATMIKPQAFGEGGIAKLIPKGSYGGERWHNDAIEQFPPPFKALLAYSCRDVGTNSMLLARIDYEKSTMTDADRKVVRQMLDDIGDALEHKLAPR